MTITCGRCSRANPQEAQFCYFDGAVLNGPGGGQNGPLHIGSRMFPQAFVFPSGRQCHNFDQLALACQDDGLSAIKLLQSGDLPRFLSTIGRSDLAQAGREVLNAPNKAIGFDGFLATLPSTVLAPPSLVIEPTDINLGDLKAGENRTLKLHLVNRGMRLIHGNVFCEGAPWLSIGDASGVQEKLFQFSGENDLQIVVRGDKLSASNKPLEGKVRFRSSGGDVTVLVRGNVPTATFSGGVLNGCQSPRQLAELARLHPREAAEFFESGDVEKWYRANGWSYPVKGASSSGLGAIQQFFEALGLAKAPKVELTMNAVSWNAAPGEALRQLIEVRTDEKRNVFAVAQASEPWLKIECEMPKGQKAPVELIVPSVPDRPGENIEAKVYIQSNGNQRFVVPVRLSISGTPRPKVVAESHPPHVFVPLPTESARYESSIPAPAVDALPVAELRPAPQRVQDEDDDDGARGASSITRWIIPLAPLALLLMILGLCLPIHDFFFVKPLAGLSEEDEPIDAKPKIVIKMHNKLGEDLLPGTKEPFDFETERFGVAMIAGEKEKPKKLTYDLNGRSNNTVIRLDGLGEGHEFIYGHPSRQFVTQLKQLDKDDDRERHSGYRSIWALKDGKIPITQTVELVAGGAAPGADRRYYDTCLVTYKIENRDDESHEIGLRFMLDTYIGQNDGVPFTLPGSNKLCDTSEDFREASKIPDYIEARENASFKDPGTIARLQLKLGQRYEAPSRVTLGAWPNPDLRNKDKRCKSYMTLWDVPVLPIKAIQDVTPEAEADSCVVMYWPEKDLAPGKTRELAFAYGLGSLASDKDGKLGLTVPPYAVKGAEFSVTVLVKNPTRDQTVTLQLPSGLELRDGRAEQDVPSSKDDVSPVTWKVRAAQSGVFKIEVKSSTGGSVWKKIRVKDKDIFN